MLTEQLYGKHAAALYAQVGHTPSKIDQHVSLLRLAVRGAMLWRLVVLVPVVTRMTMRAAPRGGAVLAGLGALVSRVFAMCISLRTCCRWICAG